MGNNPFATKYTRPGAIPFLFKSEVALKEMLDVLEANNYFGQIIGPHGSGKTTLAFELRRHLEDTFNLFRYLTVRPPRKPFGSLEMVEMTQQGEREVDEATVSMFLRQVDISNRLRTMFFFDGWGQVESYHRSLFIENCRRNGIGLVVTVHRKRSVLPVVAEIQSDRAVFMQIVRYLQRNSIIELSGGVVERAYVQASGNFREAFMLLYDIYDTRYKQKLRDTP